MIKKPTGYDEAAAYTGEFQQLPKGKYVCVIKRVATQKSKNGNEQFVILYDIAEGDQKGFYQKMFDNDKSQNPERSGAVCLNRTWKARDFPGLRVLLPQSNVQTTLHSSGTEMTTRKR